MSYVNCSPNGLAVRLAWLALLACIRAQMEAIVRKWKPSCANGCHRALFADDMPAAKVVTDMVWAKVGTEIWAKKSWLKSIETMTP